MWGERPTNITPLQSAGGPRSVVADRGYDGERGRDVARPSGWQCGQGGNADTGALHLGLFFCDTDKQCANAVIVDQNGYHNKGFAPVVRSKRQERKVSSQAQKAERRLNSITFSLGDS